MSKKPDKLVWPKTKKHPIETAGFLGSLFFTWLHEMIQISRKKAWTQEMHYDLPDFDRVENHKARLEKAFNQKRGIFQALIAAYSGPLLTFCFVALVLKGLSLSTATFTSSALRMITDRVDITIDSNFRQLISYFALMAFITPMTGIINAFFRFQAARLSVAIRSAIYSLLQDKIMKFSTMNSTKFSEGLISNLIQVDSVQVAELVTNMYWLVDGLSGLIIGMIFMHLFADWKLTIAVTGIYVSLNVLYLIVYYFRNQVSRDLLKAKDERMSYFKNILENMDFVKINALENYYCMDMFKRREKEIKQIRRNAWVIAGMDFVGMFIPYMSTWLMILYMIYVEENDKIDYGFFVGLTQLFTDVQNSFNSVLERGTFFIQIRVSMKRMNNFLNAKEINQSFVETTDARNSDIAIKVQHGDFKWKYGEGEEIQILSEKNQKREQRKLNRQQKNMDN